MVHNPRSGTVFLALVDLEKKDSPRALRDDDREIRSNKVLNLTKICLSFTFHFITPKIVRVYYENMSFLVEGVNLILF